ncbi:MAG: dTMP kinase [Gammaproteobacteria bacterium]|nr:dTMP kinase [Gammaproteobacteria bacterium]
MLNSLFITLEGIEGVGKTTAVETVASTMISIGKDVLITREPGGTSIGEQVREILLSRKNECITPTTELLLLLAARNQHLQEVVIPALELGKCVICDRYIDATFAYQGAGRKLGDALVSQANALIPDLAMPDLTILLDATPELGLKRVEMRGLSDRFEIEYNTFFEDVRGCYLRRASEQPQRILLVDASRTLGEVTAEIKNHLMDKFL